MNSAEPPKKKKKKKADGEPKRPTTWSLFYTSSIREDVKKKNPKAVGELSKIYGQMWADLSDEDKKPFQDKNNKEDKERYAKEMEEWKKNNA